MRRIFSATRVLAGLGVLLLALSALDSRGQALSTAGGPGSYLSVGGGVSAFQEDYGQQVIGGGVAWVFHSPWTADANFRLRAATLVGPPGPIFGSYFVGIGTRWDTTGAGLSTLPTRAPAQY